MPTPKKGPRLGGSAAHQSLMIANLCKELIKHKSITTTEAKARGKNVVEKTWLVDGIRSLGRF